MADWDTIFGWSPAHAHDFSLEYHLQYLYCQNIHLTQYTAPTTYPVRFLSSVCPAELELNHNLCHVCTTQCVGSLPTQLQQSLSHLTSPMLMKTLYVDWMMLLQVY